MASGCRLNRLPMLQQGLVLQAFNVEPDQLARLLPLPQRIDIRIGLLHRTPFHKCI